jgi:hypothetical protein
MGSDSGPVLVAVGGVWRLAGHYVPELATRRSWPRSVRHVGHRGATCVTNGVADAVVAAPPEGSSPTATLDDAGVTRNQDFLGRSRAVLDHLRVIGHAGPLAGLGPHRALASRMLAAGAVGAVGVFAG